MASFGRYQTVHELHRSGFTVIYSGQAAAEPEEKFAIKVFQPSTLLLETEQTQAGSGLFLNSAHIQQKTAESGAKHWARIYESGSTPDGAFYVTDKFDRSLQQLIDVHIKLGIQTLNEIIDSIAKGLLELKQACRRPHGNLKATNILIAGEGDISQTTIVLSDPLPDENIDTKAHWDNDLRAIAEFIYQLIMRRPITAVGGWQIPDSKEWTSLGKQANDWRNLCNRLLNAPLKPGTMTIEMLIEELARLKKTKPAISSRRLIAAGIAVIACIVILIIFWPKGPPPEKAQWANLCNEYLVWVGPLYEDLGFRKSNARVERWSKHEDLKKIVEKVKESASYPYKVALNNTTTVESIKDADVNKLKKLKAYDDETKKALEAIKEIKGFFDPSATDPNVYKPWPLLVKIHETANNFNEHGWKGPAKSVEDLIENVKPGLDNEKIAGNVDKILELQQSLDDIESQWVKIEENQKIIQSTGAPILAKVPDYIQSKLVSADLDTLGSELEQISSSADKLAKVIEANWQKLEENQKIIESTGDRVLAKVTDYIQTRLASADLDTLGSELEQISSSADKLAKVIEANWQKLEENQKIIESTGDRVLAEFPDYIESTLASADLDTLGSELEQISSLADKMAEFINTNWEKIDKKTFLNDHGNDSVAILTDDTFTNRLDTIDGYIFLDPNPLNEIFKLENFINDYLPLVRASNPIAARGDSENFDKLQQDINNIKVKPVIKKYQDSIDDLKLRLQKLQEKVIVDAEKPEKFIDRIKEQKMLSAEALEEVNKKWLTLRDKLLDGYPLPALKENLGKYTELRRKIDDTIRNLEQLNEELITELPSELQAADKKVDWNNKIEQFYAQDRKDTIARIIENVPMPDGIPDINSTSFNQFCRNQYSPFQQMRVDLSGILAAFNNIEDGLESCHLLDEKLPDSDQTVRLLWTRWKDTEILKEPRINEPLAALTKRVEDLEEIEKSDDRDTLGEIATDSNSQTEAVYAAWTRLGELTNPLWPTETQDFDIERRIQERLKGEFGEIGDTDRERELLTKVGEIALEREIVFRKASIGRFRKTIEQNYAEDKILADIASFVSTEIDSRKTLAELGTLENLTNKLAGFVSQEDWQKDKYRRDLFRSESNIYQSYVSISGDNLEETVEAWSKQVEDYKIVEDPRLNYDWDKKIAEITKLIEDELNRKQGDASKQNIVKKITGITKLFENALGGKQTSSSEQLIEKLKQEYTKLTETEQQIKAMQAIPAIEKNKDKIDANTCIKFWKTLEAHEATVRSIIKPEYCGYLELAEGKVQRLVFASTTELSANFEPINISRLQSVTEREPLLSAVFKFVQGSAESILSLSTGILKKLPLSQLGELFNKSVEVTGWEQIRQAVKNKDEKWLSFFNTVDLSKTKNVGWPQYIVSKKDPSMILRFIPASSGNPEPFYMAIHEITNAQYRDFLEKTTAISKANSTGWSWFTDQSNRNLILCTGSDNPPCAITWDNSQKAFAVADADAEVPVTYVTYYGAQSYAESLGAQLPIVSQHKYACEAGTGNLRPWGNNLSEISSYAHVRAGLWQNAANEYNSKVGTLDEIPPPPVGAVSKKDFTPYDAKLETGPDYIINNDTTYTSAWPVAGANKPNIWGLYDMVGNVWEWCKYDKDDSKSVICGGSCLAPPEYLRLDTEFYYEYIFDEVACDVGFRIIVPAR